MVNDQDCLYTLYLRGIENGEGKVFVQGADGNKVIAPGTGNSYTFKLKNTGTTPLNYLLNVDAFVTPGDVRIPVESRINRYDGEWIVGDKEQYVDVHTLDTAEDSAPLGAGKYTYYTLDWRWPFESGDDEYDTLLGNMAVEQDLTLTIIISTTAVADEEPTDPDDPDNPDRPGVDPEDPDKPKELYLNQSETCDFLDDIFFLSCKNEACA